MKIFISHRHDDKELAQALVNLLKQAFPSLENSDICCTSLPRHGLRAGADNNLELASKTIKAEVFIALLTPNIFSKKDNKFAYMIFELGARWGVPDKGIIPLLAHNFTINDVPAPLNGLNLVYANEVEAMEEVLGDISNQLKEGVSHRISTAIRIFCELAKKEIDEQPAENITSSIKKSEPIATKKKIDHFIDNGDGTVTDQKTNLMWMRCSIGQTWDGTTCKGEANRYDWDDAKQIAKDTFFAGYKDWRLPTIEELHTLVYCSNGKVRKFKENGYHNIESEGGYGCQSDARGDFQKPTINKQVFPNTSTDWYWSSSPFVSHYYDAWILDFEYGSGNDTDRSYDFYVRLVRSGQ